MHRVAWEGADWGVSSRGAIPAASPDVPLDPPPWWATRECLTACRRPHTDDSLQPVTVQGEGPSPHTLRPRLSWEPDQERVPMAGIKKYGFPGHPMGG